jgi:hypothetical protein
MTLTWTLTWTRTRTPHFNLPAWSLLSSILCMHCVATAISPLMVILHTFYFLLYCPLWSYLQYLRFIFSLPASNNSFFQRTTELLYIADSTILHCTLYSILWMTTNMSSTIVNERQPSAIKLCIALRHPPKGTVSWDFLKLKPLRLGPRVSSWNVPACDFKFAGIFEFHFDSVISWHCTVKNISLGTPNFYAFVSIPW